MQSVERTIVIGERAVGLMRAYSQSSTPRAYEIFYTFVSGLKPALNDEIKALVAAQHSLSADDIERVFETFICAPALDQQADETSAGLLSEVRKVLGLIETASGSTERYGTSLEQVNQDLRTGLTESKVREIVDSLIDATRSVAATNRMLQDSLEAAKGEVEGLRQVLDSVRAEALTDPLTGIPNRKSFELSLSNRVSDAQRDMASLVLVVIDIDHFKRFNDEFGHLTGDQVLRLVVSAMRENMPEGAILARFGGEEFGMILPGADEPSAFACAENIRRNVMGRELLKRASGESLGRITISLGVAQLRETDTISSLLERADLCMYRAKRAGRNRTVTDWDPSAPGMSSAA